MRPAESFVGQPIRSLQTMLRVIGENDDSLPSVVPDGIYGADTVKAVSAFQRRYGLGVNGVTDQQTWDAIVPVYENALIEQDEAFPLRITLNPGQIIRRGEQDPNIYVVQAILTVLSQTYNSIPAPGFSGILDIATSDALAAFQELSFLPASGELNKITWKHLALHYPMAANIAPPD